MVKDLSMESTHQLELRLAKEEQEVLTTRRSMQLTLLSGVWTTSNMTTVIMRKSVGISDILQ